MPLLISQGEDKDVLQVYMNKEILMVKDIWKEHKKFEDVGDDIWYNDQPLPENVFDFEPPGGRRLESADSRRL